MADDKTIPQFRRPYDFRKGPLRIWNAHQAAMIALGPFKVWLHLHVDPNERTDEAAFEIRAKVCVRILWGDTELYKADLLSDSCRWGLCVRLGNEWKKAP